MAEKIVFFDGMCNLCVGIVQFIIKKDRQGRLKFSSLQSNLGQKILAENGFEKESFKTFLFLENGRLYSHSTAALRMVRYLSGLWPLLYSFIAIPSFIRDKVYHWVSVNRFKWFGKKKKCWMPNPDLNKRFLDE